LCCVISLCRQSRTFAHSTYSLCWVVKWTLGNFTPDLRPRPSLVIKALYSCYLYEKRNLLQGPAAVPDIRRCVVVDSSIRRRRSNCHLRTKVSCRGWPDSGVRKGSGPNHFDTLEIVAGNTQAIHCDLSLRFKSELHIVVASNYVDFDPRFKIFRPYSTSFQPF